MSRRYKQLSLMRRWENLPVPERGVRLLFCSGMGNPFRAEGEIGSVIRKRFARPLRLFCSGMGNPFRVEGEIGSVIRKRFARPLHPFRPQRQGGIHA